MGDDSNEALPGESSLGGNIAKALFLTINVSDLDRAVEFYEATYPVTRAEVVDPPVQAFNGFGIPKGQFRARMMRDAQAFQGSAILLVQWLSPGPVGTPYAEANHLGWYREHANASSAGQNARYEAVLKYGGRPYGPPSSIYITPTQQIYSFGFRDPDGTTLEWVGPLDPTPGGPPDTSGDPTTTAAIFIARMTGTPVCSVSSFKSGLTPCGCSGNRRGRSVICCATPTAPIYG